MARFTILLYPEDGGYSVIVPSLPGCVTQGDTFEEAVAMARDAIELHVRGMLEDGEEVPAEDTSPIPVAVDVAIPEPSAV